MRILSGVQSSGKLHLGNYYGAIREFVRLQDEGEALYFIANLHALNSVRDGKLARELTLETAAAFIALGVDPVGKVSWVEYQRWMNEVPTRTYRVFSR